MNKTCSIDSIITELVQNSQFGDSQLSLNGFLINSRILLSQLHNYVPATKALSKALTSAGRKLQVLIMTDPVVNKTIEEAVLLTRQQSQDDGNQYHLVNELCVALTEWLVDLKANPIYTPLQKFGVGMESDK